MAENFRVQLRHPILVFIVIFSILLIGCSIGIHWHPSKTAIAFIAISGALLGVIHEVFYGILWFSLTAWWIGTRQRTNDKSREQGPVRW